MKQVKQAGSLEELLGNFEKLLERFQRENADLQKRVQGADDHEAYVAKLQELQEEIALSFGYNASTGTISGGRFQSFKDAPGLADVLRQITEVDLTERKNIAAFGRLLGTDGGADSLLGRVHQYLKDGGGATDEGELLPTHAADAEALAKYIGREYLGLTLSPEEERDVATLGAESKITIRDILEPLIGKQSAERKELKNLLHYFLISITGWGPYDGDPDIVPRATLSPEAQGKLTRWEGYLGPEYGQRINELQAQVDAANNLGIAVAESVMLNILERATGRPDRLGDAVVFTMPDGSGNPVDYTRRDAYKLYTGFDDQINYFVGEIKSYLEQRESQAKQEGREERQPEIDELRAKAEQWQWGVKWRRWRARVAEEKARSNNKTYVQRLLDRVRVGSRAHTIYQMIKTEFDGDRKIVSSDRYLDPAAKQARLTELDTQYWGKLRVALERVIQ
jgi:hypothetical protein